jgi:hypothetical protein
MTIEKIATIYLVTDSLCNGIDQITRRQEIMLRQLKFLMYQGRYRYQDSTFNLVK